MREDTGDPVADTIYSLKRRLRREWAGHPDLEDAIQEASVRVWQDYASGITSIPHLFNRGRRWALAVFTDGRGTGRQAATTRDVPPVTREKVTQYRTQWRELHGSWPSTQQTAQGVGLSPETVQRCFRKVSLQRLTVTDDRGLDTVAPEVDAAAASPLDETELLCLQADLAVALRRLDAEERAAVVLTHWGGLSQREAAARMGVSQMQVSRILRRAYGKMRQALDTSLPEAGHKTQ